MNQYDVWWARLPEPSGTRPVLVLSRDGAHRYLARLLVVEITSKVRGLSQEVIVGRAEGLARRSVANFDNVAAIPTSWLVERIGRLHPGRIDEAKRALGCTLAWPELARIPEDRYR